MARIRLLLVEDEPDIREVIGLALNLDIEIEVRSYETAEAALESIEAEGLVFDVALLDFQLPQMNGLELYLHLRTSGAMPDLVAALITAFVGKADLQVYEQAGIAGVIAKPFDPLSLAREVRAFVHANRPAGSKVTWLGKMLRIFR